MAEISSFQKKPKIQLITVDSDKKIFHFNGCKLIINTIGKCLLMEPKSKNVKVYVANFEKSYYRFKNILCILDSQDNIYNFMLILRSEESCEKTLNPIQKRKEVKDINLSNFKLFQQLLCPILNGIQPNKTLKAEITPILMTLFNSFTEEEKIKCREYLKEIKMEFLCEFFDNTVVHPEKVNNKRKRTLRNRESVDGINVEGVVQPTKSKHICNLLDNNSENYASDSSDIIKSTYFNVISFPNNCFERKKLFVFPENDKSKRYEYYWDNRRNAFVCCGCARMKKCVTTQIFKENEQDFVKLKKSMHICKESIYNPAKYSSKIVKSLDFKIFSVNNNDFSKSRLFVFDDEDKSLGRLYFPTKAMSVYRCRGCECKGKYMVAEFCQDQNGNDYLKVPNINHGASTNLHLCQPALGQPAPKDQPAPVNLHQVPTCTRQPAPGANLHFIRLRKKDKYLLLKT